MPGQPVPLREATSYGQGPKYLLRDRDSKFGPSFARVAATGGIKILQTPYHAKRPNAICERFLGSVRRECLDHLLILQEKQHEPRAGRICEVLQPSQASSRDQAADSGATNSATATRSHRWEDPLLPGPGRAPS